MCVVEWIGKLIWHVLPSATTVMFGGFILQRFFIRKSNASSFADSIIRELYSIRSDALEYWTVNDQTNSRKLESQLKGSILTVISDLDYYCQRYEVDRFTRSKFELLEIALSDAVTGGEFEQKKRKANPERYLVIVNITNKVKSELQRTKI